MRRLPCGGADRSEHLVFAGGIQFAELAIGVGRLFRGAFISSICVVIKTSSRSAAWGVLPTNCFTSSIALLSSSAEAE